MSTKKGFLKSSSNLRTKDEKKDKEEDCYASIYLSLFNDLNEEITTIDELILLLQYAGCNPSKKDLKMYWDENTNSYTFSQFCSILKQVKRTTKNDLMKAFKRIDRNNDGFITHDELFEILTKKGERMTKAEVKMMIDDADFNGDGKLDYLEFCSMMSATTKQLQELYASKSSESPMIKDNNQKPNVTNPSDEIQHSSYSNTKKIIEDKRIPIKDESKASLRKLSCSGSKSSTLETIPKEKSAKEHSIVRNQVTSEPKDLMKWQFNSSKGCFYKEEDGLITSHQFQLKITQPTPIWIALKAKIPKYGKINEDVLDSDMTIFLVETTSGKLISFSDSIIEEKVCLHADVDIGIYDIFTYSSGCKLTLDESDSGKVVLAKGTGDECRLTKLCKDSLMEIFYRCDLDGNGFLNRQEFNEFQKRSSGEECDDEAWDVVKETVDLNPNDEITLKGFLELNLMEVRDPEGGQDELWVTLESLGYSNKLLLAGACPFFIEVYSRRGQSMLSMLGISDGGVNLYNALLVSIKEVSNTKAIKNKRDLHLHVANFVNRTTIAVENQSHSTVKVQVNCSGSENLISNNGLNVTTDIDSRRMTILHHLVLENKNVPMKLKYQETILRP